MEGKLLLIDGHSMINRAFYGVPVLTNSKGFHTNAIYGFLNIMISTIESEKPDYLAVAFDLKEPTFRHLMYDAYKGNRKPMPEELREQVPVLKELLVSMGIKIVTLKGYEADDILGTYSVIGEKNGLSVCILSGDRDLLQLCTKKVKVRMPHTKGGKTETEEFYEADVLSKYQVEPKGIIELKALMGDSSDNIPGVPKIGEKTATSLVVTYGCIEELKKHIDEISKKSIRETLTENFSLAELSKTLATINTESPVEYGIEEFRLGDIYTSEAYDRLSELGIKKLQSYFEHDKKGTQTVEIKTALIEDYNDALESLKKAYKAKKAGVILIGDTDSVSKKGSAAALAVSCDENEAFVIPVGGFITEDFLLEGYLGFLSKDTFKGTLAVYDLKEQLHFFDECAADDIKGSIEDNIENIISAVIFDVRLMSYLNAPLISEPKLSDIAGEFLQLHIPQRKEVFEKRSFKKVLEELLEVFADYAGRNAAALFGLLDILKTRLEQKELLEIYTGIEFPLIPVLYGMEKRGILVKGEELSAYGEKLSGRIGELESEIIEECGVTFNINSPKQLGEVLFEKLMLPGGKKTKTGYSTAAEVLEKLSEDYKVVRDILEYRALTKLKSTYAESLSGFIASDGRIHTAFLQMVTATGRLSSADPNLQNIPVRTALGRELRRVFVPKEGYVFVDADYSQIELRILAAMSGDESLIKAYNMGSDIHSITASQVFNVPVSEVDATLRRNAKAVNFGIVYGISSFGLSQDLSIDRKTAKEYIDRYFETYPGIKAFLDSLIDFARQNGYAKTLYGRRRPVPELSNSNFMQRQFGERVAMNAPIQGTAADIMKIAMLRVDRALRREGLKARILLQVHDELLIETPVIEKDRVMTLLANEMAAAREMAVALETSVSCGETWYDVK